jgi:AraC family transcriptional activator of pobA
MPTYATLNSCECPGNANMNFQGFNVYKIGEVEGTVPFPCHRADLYYFILLDEGNGTIQYADKKLKVGGGSLVLTDPAVAYVWEPEMTGATGYLFLLKKAFFREIQKDESTSSTLFNGGSDLVLYPELASFELFRMVLEQMFELIRSGYKQHMPLLLRYIQMILQRNLTLLPEESEEGKKISSTRTSEQFLMLLHTQFPLTSPQHILRFRSAGDFANELAVHPNYLSRVLKKETGKGTSEHIAKSIAKEAKDLLQYTNWDTRDIARCLGFNHTSNFNIAFKKQLGVTPTQFKKQLVEADSLHN